MNNQNQHQNEPSAERDSEIDALIDSARRVDDKYAIDPGRADQAYQKVAQKARLKNHTNTSASYWKYAAAALFVFGLIGAGVFFTPVEIQVPNGQLVTVRLPDNSEVTLNSGSELTYARWFNILDRTVSLEGEAYFDVKSNGKKFVVNAGDAQIEVLGTKFNVQSWPEQVNARTTVFLAEGRVAFSSNKSSVDPVILNPGE